MCGFFIELSPGNHGVGPGINARGHLERRGPDSTNFVSGDNWSGEFYRLAIVSEVGVGEQPIRFDKDKFLF